MGKLYFRTRTNEYRLVDILGGFAWFCAYDAATALEVGGVRVYERVGRVYRLFGFIVWGSNQR